MCSPAHRTSLAELCTPLSSFANPDFIVLECFLHTVTKTLSFPHHLKWLLWTCIVQNWFQHQLIIISSTQCRTAGIFPPFKQMCFCCTLNNSKASGWGARPSDQAFIYETTWSINGQTLSYTVLVGHLQTFIFYCLDLRLKVYTTSFVKICIQCKWFAHNTDGFPDCNRTKWNSDIVKLIFFKDIAEVSYIANIILNTVFSRKIVFFFLFVSWFPQKY